MYGIAYTFKLAETTLNKFFSSEGIALVTDRGKGVAEYIFNSEVQTNPFTALFFLLSL